MSMMSQQHDTSHDNLDESPTTSSFDFPKAVFHFSTDHDNDYGLSAEDEEKMLGEEFDYLSFQLLNPLPFSFLLNYVGMFSWAVIIW